MPSRQNKTELVTRPVSYQLMENNFVQLEELRKSMGSNANAPSKCFYLFTVDMNQVARMIVDTCHKAIGNALVRKNHEASTNQVCSITQYLRVLFLSKSGVTESFLQAAKRLGLAEL